MANGVATTPPSACTRGCRTRPSASCATCGPASRTSGSTGSRSGTTSTRPTSPATHCHEAVAAHAALACHTDAGAVRLARLLRRLPAPGGARQRHRHDRPPLRRAGRPRPRRRLGQTSTTPTASRSRPPASGSTCSTSRSSASAACSARSAPTSTAALHLTDARCEPKPVQAELPIWVGGGGEKRTLRIAAQLRRRVERAVRRARGRSPTSGRCSPTTARTVGRDPTEIRCAVNVGLAAGTTTPSSAQFGELAEAVRPGVLIGSPDQLVDRIGEYVEAGADQVNIALRAPWDLDALDAWPPCCARCERSGRRSGAGQPDRRAQRLHRRAARADGDRPRHDRDRPSPQERCRVPAQRRRGRRRQRARRRRAIRTSIVEVVAVEDVHPHLRRITSAAPTSTPSSRSGPTRSSTCCSPRPGATS